MSKTKKNLTSSKFINGVRVYKTRYAATVVAAKTAFRLGPAEVFEVSGGGYIVAPLGAVHQVLGQIVGEEE